MRRRRSLRTASATPEARCALEAGRTIQLRPDAKDTQTTALPGSHHAIAARARPPSPPFQNVDAPPAAVRPPPSPPWSVYHSLSIVPVDAVTPPGGHGPPARGLPAPRRRARRAPPGHRRAPGGLPARGGGGRRRRGPAAVRRARVPGVRVAYPLSTLQPAPRDAACKTRGQDGFAILLSCRALSSPTTCRFIPAHPI